MINALANQKLHHAYLFSGTRPGAEFAISFDLDALKIYEDFDKCERIAFKNQEAKSDKEYRKQRRIYELSAVDKPAKNMPFQPSFRHLTTIVQVYEGDLNDTIDHYKKLYGVKPYIFPNGVSLNRLKTISKNNIEKKIPKQFILFSGSYMYKPNKAAIDILIDKIMPALTKDLPKLKLVLTGGGVTHRAKWLINLGIISKENSIHMSNLKNLTKSDKTKDK